METIFRPSKWCLDISETMKGAAHVCCFNLTVSRVLKTPHTSLAFVPNKGKSHAGSVVSPRVYFGTEPETKQRITNDAYARDL